MSFSKSFKSKTQKTPSKKAGPKHDPLNLLGGTRPPLVPFTSGPAKKLSPHSNTVEPWRLRPKGEGHGRQAPAFPTRREHAQPSFWDKPLPLARRIPIILHSAWPGHPKPKHSMPVLIRSHFRNAARPSSEQDLPAAVMWHLCACVSLWRVAIPGLLKRKPKGKRLYNATLACPGGASIARTFGWLHVSCQRARQTSRGACLTLRNPSQSLKGH